MNRKIKFRGKRLDNNKWIYGDLLQYQNDAVCIWDHKLGWLDVGSHRVDPKTVGQYVGFSDKNDNDIYEGDIDVSGMIVSYLGDNKEGLGMTAGFYLQRDNYESWIELETKTSENKDNYEIIRTIYDK